MSEKGFSVDEILKELRGNSTDEIRADYHVQDAHKVVSEVLSRTAQLAKTQTPLTTPNEKLPLQSAATSKLFSVNALAAEEQPPSALTQRKEAVASAVLPVPEGSTKPVVDEKTLLANSEQPNMEQKSLQDMKLSTTHLRYISLRKDRAQRVKDFVLNPSEGITQAVEFEMDEEASFSLDLDKQVEAEDFEELEEEIQIDMEMDEHEYTDPAQKSSLLLRIQLMLSHAKRRCVGLGSLFVLSLIFVFIGQIPTAPIALISKLQSPLIYAGIQFLFLMGGCFICYDALVDGIKSLAKWELNRKTTYALAMASSLIAGLAFLVFPASFAQPSVEFYVPLCLMCLFSWPFGQLLSAKRIALNYPIVVESEEKCTVCVMNDQKLAEDFTKEAVEDPFLVYNRKALFLNGFMTESFSEDISDRLPQKTIPLLLGAAVVAAAFAVIMGDGAFTAITAFNAVLLLGAGMVPAFFCNYPLYHVARSLTRLGGAVLGYHAVERFAEANAAALSAKEIFKGSDVTLYGIKTFSNIPIDRAILDAACVLNSSHSILGEVFLNIINHRTDYLDEVETVLYEDGMGISAWVGERRVLIGSRELMVHHNISVPNREYEDKYIANERHLIYLSTNGDLSAVFVIGLECSADIANLVAGLYGNGVTAIVKTVDPIITGSLLAKVFHLPEDAFRVIPSRLHKEMDKLTSSSHSENAAVCNDGKLASYLYSFLLAKGLQRSIDFGKMVNFFSMVLGVLLVVGFTAIHGLGQLGSLTLCLYQAISLGVCFVIQKLTRL